MSEKEQARPLGKGLPRCLRGLRDLQRQLCLSTRTEPSRRDVLEGRYVVDRIGPSNSVGGRKADRDRKRMLAFYGDPELRRELWERHLEGLPAAPSGRSDRIHGGELLPPSLEFQVLGRLWEGQARPVDAPEPAAPHEGAGEAESLSERICERLEGWTSLTGDERNETILQVFCLATLLDNGGLIDDACAAVPELADEFQELLLRPDGAGSPAQGNAGNEWRSACLKLAELASRAATGPGAEAALCAVRQATAALELLDARTVLHELKSALGSFLEEVERDPSCSAIDDEQLDDLRGRWIDVHGGGTSAVRAELRRLRRTFRAALATVRKLARRHEKTEGELTTLRQEAPTRGKPRRDWETRRAALRQAADDLLRERRAAEETLLDGLAPSEKLVHAATPETHPATTSGERTRKASGAGAGDGNVEPRVLQETADLRERLKALEQDAQSYRSQRDDLRRNLHEANVELSSLKAGTHHSRAANGQGQTDFLLQLAARKEGPRPLECIEAITRTYADRCVVLETARDSAREMDQFRHGRKLLQLLRTLVTEYRDQLRNGGDAEARRLLGASYAAKESQTVIRNADLRRHRVFRHEGRDLEMFQHLKIGTKADQRQTIRVHFAWDASTERIIIGHCGKHLPRLTER